MSDQQLPDPASAPRSRRRLSARSIAVIAAGSALVLTVAGTAAAFALAPQESEPQAEAVEPSNPIETPTPTPTPIPTEEPVDRPDARFQTACTELVPESLVIAMTGGSVELRSNDPVTSLIDAAELQEGALSCSWGSGGSGSPNLEVYLIPEVADIFTNHLDEGVADAFGDRSVHGCTMFPDMTECRAAILVGDTWLGIVVHSAFPADELQSRLDMVAPQLVTTVRAIEITPAVWTPEPSVLTSEYMWGESAPLVAAAFGIPNAAPYGYDEIGPLAGIVWERSGFSMVPFEQRDRGVVTIDTLPGGGWAAAELAQRPGAVSVKIPGAEHASSSTVGNLRQLCFATRGAGMCISATYGDTLVAQATAFVASLPGA